MIKVKQISTGIEDFKTVIDNDYYYVDKTQLIADVFSNAVMLYTRPRRFGKTLNMSMLYYFFSNKEKDNDYLFEGLKITENKEMMKHQNQYPVIYITLKDMKAANIEQQVDKFRILIQDVVNRYYVLMKSSYLNEIEKKELMKLLEKASSLGELEEALKKVSQCLMKHYGKKAIILIDEYDVPLQSAFIHDYYDEMTMFLGNIFSSALKTNTSLERGVLTGCLQIAKESIFTGLNNFTVRSITSQYGGEYFGFTQNEINETLNYYNLNDKKEEMKEWYDGYLFGEIEIYNPWSSMNYILELLGNIEYPAISFWANTSGNDIVRQYIENSTQTMKKEFELLINGKSIIKKIVPELTYREMRFETKEDMNDDIYSFLLYTGYLKIQDKVYDDSGKQIADTYKLVIPNKEVKTIYDNIFMKWFDEYQRVKRNTFINELINGNVINAIDYLSDVLENSISYYDNYESFYHGFMIGFLKADGYEVKSNRESGKGRFDIALIPARKTKTCIVIECKHSFHEDDLIEDSQKAAKQIETNDYLKSFESKGYRQVLGYGISFYKKQCYITKV
ncbi:AAA family ATPase [Thomasclavelia cocleata]|uniref:AAA family ATPase n=1 Tax=Thomasclavelia cocleata TaxID=69824 RepID=UPI00248C8777|nr:AAA family ATPase [Thomasclavelia cocleata]